MKIYKPDFACSLYGCETWSLASKGDHTLKITCEQGTEENIWAEEG
jgi:hypothetical protein